jgi:hypothetical protein
MPIKISSGVIRNPPPMPSKPDNSPTSAPIVKTTNGSTGIWAIGR